MFRWIGKRLGIVQAEPAAASDWAAEYWAARHDPLEDFRAARGWHPVTSFASPTFNPRFADQRPQPIRGVAGDGRID